MRPAGPGSSTIQLAERFVSCRAPGVAAAARAARWRLPRNTDASLEYMYIRALCVRSVRDVAGASWVASRAPVASGLRTAGQFHDSLSQSHTSVTDTVTDTRVAPPDARRRTGARPRGRRGRQRRRAGGRQRGRQRSGGSPVARAGPAAAGETSVRRRGCARVCSCVFFSIQS